MFRQINRTHTSRVQTLVMLLVLSLTLTSYPGIPPSAELRSLDQPYQTGINKTSSASTTAAVASPGGGAVLIGQRVAGIIDNNADAKVYQFQGVAGESVRIEANATSGDLDPTATLFVDPSLRSSTRQLQTSPPPSGKLSDTNIVEDEDRDDEGRELRAYGGAIPLVEPAATPQPPMPTLNANERAVAAFSRGDVFAAVGQGKVKRFSPTGTLLQTLDSGSGSNENTGMGFDAAGNLYSTQFQASSVYKFDINGNLVGAFGSGYDSHPESVVVDSAQNVFIGQADGSRLVRKFNPAGTLLDTFAPSTGPRGTDWIDLASDQRTLFYTSEGNKVKRYDLVTKAQLADLNATNLPGTYAYALRILPGGGVLVADNETIVRLDAAGNIVQQYDAPNEDVWFAVNLDPDGQTFWSGNLASGKVYRFNIATGAVVTSWDSGKFTSLAGLTVFGEITAAQVLSISKSAPATVKSGDVLTYTINYGNSGTANAANVVIKDTLPTGTSFVSASNGGTLVNGVVTWNIGTLNAGVTGQTVSYTVRAGGSGKIVNSDYTIEATGIAPVNGAPVTTSIVQVIFDDNSGGGANALIKTFQLPFTGTYRVLVASSAGASSGGYEIAVLPVDEDSNVVATQVGGTNSSVKEWGTKASNNLIFQDSISGTPVTFQAFSPDGMSVATQSGGTTPAVRVYSTKTGGLIFQDSISGTPVTFAGFAPDGASIATQVGGSTGSVKVWSTRANNSLIFQDSISGTGTAFVGFAPDGSSVAIQVGGSTPAVKLWSTRQANSLILQDSISGTPVTFAGFAPDSASIADQVGGTIPAVKVWSTRVTNGLIFQDAISGTPVNFAGFAPDGSSVADQVGGTIPAVKVWTTRASNSLIFQDSISGTPVTFAGFAPDASSVADQVGGTFPAVKVWTTRATNGLIFQDSISGTPVNFAGFAPDGASVADQVGGTFSAVKVWSTRTTNNLIYQDAISGTPVTFSSFAADGASAADQVGGTTPAVRVYSARTGGLMFQDSISGTPVNFAGFSPDGVCAVTQVGGSTSSVKVWSTRSNNAVIFQDSISGTGTTFVDFAPDGSTAAIQVGGTTPAVKLWSTRQANSLIFQDSISGTPVTFAGFAPDSASTASQVGGSTPAVKVWSTRSTNSLIYQDSISGTPVNFAGFEPDGFSAASQVGGSVPAVKVWSTKTTNSLTFQDSISGTPVNFAAFSLDSDGLATQTGGSFPTVKVWSTRSNSSLIFQDSISGTPVNFATFSFDRTHGTLPTAPNIGVSSQFLDFGNVTVGQTKDLALTISNTGNAPLTISSLSFSAAQFSVTSPSVPFIVTGGQQQVVNIRFTPTSASVQTGVMAIASNDPARPGIDVFMFGNGPACLARPANMVAWYPGDGNADDIQGSNNATLQNGASFAAGEVSQAFALDGVNDQVLTPTLALGSQFSVEFWMRPTSSAAFQHVISNGYSSTSFGALYFNNNHLEYWQGGAVKVSSSATALNAFSHVALTYDGSVARLYLNGLLAGTSGTHTETFNNAVMFGYALQSESAHFAGQIDEVSFYNRALTVADVQSVVSAGSSGKCKQTPVLCTYALNPTSQNFGAGGGNGSIQITAPAGCPWTAIANSLAGMAKATPAATQPKGTATATAAFTESFENIATLPGSGWFLQNNSVPVGTNGWFQGDPDTFYAQAGTDSSYIASNYANTTGANTISNWLVTPNITFNNGDQISFYTRTVSPDFYPDRLQVRLSLNGTSTNVGSGAEGVGDFTNMLLDINPTLSTGVYPQAWTQYTLTISGLSGPTSGRAAFRYYVPDGGPSGANSFYIGIDSFAYTPAASSSWITVTAPASGTGNGTVNYSVGPNNTGSPRTGTIGIAGQNFTVNQSNTNIAGRRQSDFDGDGKTDESVFRPSDNVWYLNRSQAGFAGFQFGTAGDLIAPADFNGDGKSDLCVFRPSNGAWYVLTSGDMTFYGANFGASGDIPAPGDFDGDGKADLGVFRPSTGYWFLLQSTAGFAAIPFGTNGDVPTLGDFDGDGKTDIAVFRWSNGVWYRLNSSNGSFFGAQFGQIGDKVVPADYSGDGKTDLAVWRPSNGTWYILRSDDSSFYGQQFGVSSDIPAPGDYDGDGKADVTVFRPNGGIWFEQRSTSGFVAVQFGANGDKPAPSAFVY